MPPRPTLPGHSIPHLLSSLPTSSASSIASSSSSKIHKPIFIRPATAPPTSFYAITRSKLKFTPSDAVARASTARHPSKIVGEVKAANLPNPAPVKDGRVGGEARVRVSGRAWGRAYRDGKLVLPTSPRAKPDGKIHGAAKKKWVLVDPETIPKGVIEELNHAIAADRVALGGAAATAE